MLLASLLVLSASLGLGQGQGGITNETEAKMWLAEYSEMAMDAFYRSALASWTYQTDITDEHESAMVSFISTLQPYLHDTKKTLEA